MTIDYSQHIQSLIYLLYGGIGLVFIGLTFFQISKKSCPSLIFIALGGFSISLFLSLSDPFLHMWDEQFHAVVAKNMRNNPFKPMLLQDPVLPYYYKNWTSNHIWLHKQPLFLWQIALSFKLFGVSVLSLRLPSIIMTTLMVFPVYRMGKIFSGKQTGIFAAVFLTGSNFIYQLGAGRIATDHNDIAFLFYVTLSIWAWFEKENSEKKYWIILIGLFSGAAILNKWLVGLLVYSAWGLAILFFNEKRKRIIRYGELLLGLFITALVVLPWQLYVLYRFPAESLYEYQLNTRHFIETIEGHSGGFLYHINNIEKLYGTDFQYVIIISFVIFLVSRIGAKFKFVVVFWIFIVYIFYSFAATKLSAFTIVVAPLIYLIVGHSISVLLNRLKGKSVRQPVRRLKIVQLAGIVVVFFVFFHFLNYDRLSLKNCDWQRTDFQNEFNSYLVYKNLVQHFDDETIIFNSLIFDKYKIIFMSDLRAEIGIPTKTDLKILRDKRIKVVVFDNDKLPDYILNDSSIAKVRSLLWQKDFKEELEIYY